MNQMNQSGPNIGHHTSKDNFVPYANFSLFMEQMAQSTKQWIFFLKKKKKKVHIVLNFAPELQLTLIRKGSLENMFQSSSVAIT